MDFNIHNKVKLARGRVLVSEPFLEDPNFERTVVLLCEHTEEGSFGFVWNKKINNVQVDDLLKDHTELFNEVYLGGPVEQNMLQFIHRIDHLEGSLEIKRGMYYGGKFDQLKAMIADGLVNEDQIRFFLGYSGWTSGQLDQELNEKSWIVSNVSPNDLFLLNPEELWRTVLKKMGGKFKAISNFPKDPRLN